MLVTLAILIIGVGYAGFAWAVHPKFKALVMLGVKKVADLFMKEPPAPPPAPVAEVPPAPPPVEPVPVTPAPAT